MGNPYTPAPDEAVTFVLVEVTGAEDAVGVRAAVENLTNAEQVFTVVGMQSTTMEHVEQAGEPVIYFP